MKTEKEIIAQALNAIVKYIENYRPTEARKIRGQLGVIKEIALCALEEADDQEKTWQMQSLAVKLQR